MSIKLKTFLTILFTLVGLLVVFLGIAAISVSRGLEQAENSASAMSIVQAKSVIDERIASISTTAHDWSLWDETYEFIVSGDKSYIEGNLNPRSISVLGVNYMLYINTEGEIVHAYGVDLETVAPIDTPENLKNLIIENEVIWKHEDVETETEGLLSTEEGPVLMVSSPIGTSKAEGPIRGALILIRRIDKAELDRLSETVNYAVNIKTNNESLDCPHFSSTKGMTESVSPFHIVRISDSLMSVHTVICDVLNEPSLRLTIELPRDYYMRSMAEVKQVFILMVILWFVFGITMMALLQKQVLSRLSRLSSEVEAVGKHGDLSARVSVDGNDELKHLAEDINEMLESIEKSETTLITSEEHYRNLFENSLAGMWRINPDNYRFIQANQATAQMLGFDSPGELIADCDLVDYVNKESAEKFLQMLDKKGQISNWTSSLTLKNGSVRYLSVSCRLYRDNGFIEGVAIDITSQKHAEDALAMLAAVIEQTIEGVVISDVNGIIQYANPAFEKITGYSASAITGRNGVEILLKLVGMNLAKQTEKLMQTQGTWSGRTMCMRNDGTLYEGEIAIFPVTDEEGNPSSYVALHRDITRITMLETQLRQAHKLEAIGQLAAGIAHEISTPTRFVGENTRFVGESFGEIVNVLKKQNEILESVKNSGCLPELVETVQKAIANTDIEYLTEEIPKALEQSLEGIERVTSLVRAMKDFSHPGLSEKIEIDINKAIESTITITRNEWKYVARVVTDFDENLGKVRCYPAEFNQITLNLITNAAQAISDVSRHNSEHKGVITARTRKDGDWFEMSISDNGIGIPEETGDKIFDMFFTTKEIGQGTGQGLAISKSLVEKHEGTITYESEVGK
ncbi:MAG TPA: PAS domain S-box protein, partial [Firmicutes bacterium]|nr:PAS domain S-box protein [Bacillota bacterium]